MGSKIITGLILGLVAFIIFCIYSIVQIHDRAIKLSKSEDVEDYVAREKQRLERAKIKIAREEMEVEKLREEKNIEEDGEDLDGEEEMDY